jgi:hypothetical protein
MGVNSIDITLLKELSLMRMGVTGFVRQGKIDKNLL